MTPDELKNLDDAIKIVTRHQDWRRGAEIEMENPKELGAAIDGLIEAASTLSQLMHGTHPDLVVVPRGPTVNMWEAGVCARRKAHNYALADQVDDIYKAMIAAARKDGV